MGAEFGDRLVHEISPAYTRVLDFLDKSLRIISIGLGIVLLLVVSAMVIGRYMFSSSLVWGIELTTYLGIWISLLLAGPLIYEDNHLKVEMVFNKLPMKYRYYIRIAQLLIIAIFGWGFVNYGYFYVIDAGFRSVSPSMGIHMAWIYLIIPISGIFMIVFSIGKILDIVKNPETELTGTFEDELKEKSPDTTFDEIEEGMK